MINRPVPFETVGSRTTLSCRFVATFVPHLALTSWGGTTPMGIVVGDRSVDCTTASIQRARIISMYSHEATGHIFQGRNDRVQPQVHHLVTSSPFHLQEVKWYRDFQLDSPRPALPCCYSAPADHCQSFRTILVQQYPVQARRGRMGRRMTLVCTPSLVHHLASALLPSHRQCLHSRSRTSLQCQTKGRPHSGLEIRVVLVPSDVTARVQTHIDTSNTRYEHYA